MQRHSSTRPMCAAVGLDCSTGRGFADKALALAMMAKAPIEAGHSLLAAARATQVRDVREVQATEGEEVEVDVPEGLKVGLDGQCTWSHESKTCKPRFCNLTRGWGCVSHPLGGRGIRAGWSLKLSGSPLGLPGVHTILARMRPCQRALSLGRPCACDSPTKRSRPQKRCQFCKRGFRKSGTPDVDPRNSSIPSESGPQ